jgi:hypothetical protein
MNTSFLMLSPNMYSVNDDIIKLEEVNKLREYIYILYIIKYDNRKIGELIYSIEYDDIEFLLSNFITNEGEYDLVNNLLEKFNYLDKKFYKLPSLSITNYKTLLEYKYIDTNRNQEYNIKLKNLKNINNEEEYISTQIFINSKLLAIISTKNYDKRLTLLDNFENKDIKMFYYYLIKLTLYTYNNTDFLSDSEKTLITFNLFEDKVYNYI